MRAKAITWRGVGTQTRLGHNPLFTFGISNILEMDVAHAVKCDRLHRRHRQL